MMGWLRKIWSRMQISTTVNPAQWLIDIFSGTPSASGVRVTEQSALKFSPFWASIRIISGTVASLPFKVYRRLENDGKEPVTSHIAYRLLHERPNDFMDAVTFVETRQAHALCYGNGYAEIQRDGAGRPVALWPLLPDRTQRKIKDSVPYYEVTMSSGETAILRDENVLHIKGLGFDGYTGYNVVQYHKDAIGYGIGAKEFGARFFANDASPGGVLECPNAMSDEAYQRLKKSWNEAHQGLSKAHRLAILEEGTKWTQMGVDPRKAQLLEVQKWTVDDCARIFLIPPHKIASMEFSKYNNIEQLQIDFVSSTMLYWFRKWEQEVNYKLLMPSERGRLFCEILVDALLRGNVESRATFYNVGRQGGWLSINDIRKKENLNPVQGGDTYLDPMNMAPAGSLPAMPAPADDDVIRAHRELLTSQWQRVMTRVNKASKKGTQNGFWDKQRSTAREMLLEAVRAWAAVTRAVNAERELEAMLLTVLRDDSELEETSPAGLADALMTRIGGNHALAETQIR